MIKKLAVISIINKKRAGFLLIDSMLGLTIFIGTSCYVFIVMTNTVFLLQSLVKKSTVYYSHLSIAKALAYGIGAEAIHLLQENNLLPAPYSSSHTHMQCIMHANRLVALEIIVIKSEAVGMGDQYTIYQARRS